jgi:ABC-type antimicrobial peptide transport system permease subunit
LFIKTSEPGDVVLSLVHDRLRALDAELPLYDLAPLDERVASLVMPQRMGVTLFTFFSTLAVALAAVGIYGVASYVSALRRREIGVRLALGATSGRIRRLVLFDGAVPIALGMAAGLALALYASRVAKAFLMGVSTSDPVTFLAVTFFLAVIAAVASYLPARRAARMDPVQALRDE